MWKFFLDFDLNVEKILLLKKLLFEIFPDILCIYIPELYYY